MQTNCTVLAKLVVNKRLNTYRVLFTFDAHNRITVRNAVLQTGDICSTDYVNAEYEICKAMQLAKQQLRCNNVQVVD